MRGRPGVLQRPVIGGHRAPEVRRQALQSQVAHLLPDQTSGQTGSVHRVVGQPPVFEPDRGGIEEGEVEADVVTHDHCVPDELEERGERLVDPGGVDHHGLCDPGQDGDRGWDRQPGVDQCLEGPQQIAAPVLDGSDLGDGATEWGATCGLQVEHAERDVEQRCRQLVEAGLDQGGHRGIVAPNIRSMQRPSPDHRP